MVLKALTFDFWNTLVRERGPESLERVVVNRFANIFRRHGQERSAAEIKAAAQACRDLVMEGQVREGKEMPPEAQIEWIIRRLRLDPDPALQAEAYKAYTTAALEELPEPVPGVAAALPKLKQHLELAVICNTGRTPGSTARIVLERLGLLHYFSHLTFSNELGVAKPNPLIFHRTLAALGLKPHEVAHIGDDPRTDVKGARSAGLRAVWFNPYGRLDKVECELVLTRWEDLLSWFEQQARSGRGVSWTK